MPSQRVDRVFLSLVVVVTVLGAGIEIVQWLRNAPLWVDEEMIALNFRDRPFSRLAGPLWLGQSAPLGWLATQRAVLLTLGTSELVLRLIPLMFGIGLLIAAAWVGLRWMGGIAAMTLVAMLAVAEWISHYTFELKHYSADTFWALLLPALAVWALEQNEEVLRARRRWMLWWLTAAIGQLFANGAMLVTPACAVVMFAVILRRGGVRHVTPFVAASAIWFVTFAAHYWLSLQYTQNSRFLWSIWGGEVRPESAGLVETVRWLAGRLEPIAWRPGGATAPLLFWIAASAGFIVGRRRLPGVMFVVVPLFAMLLAVLRLVPLYDRFALWMVPALYVGIALLLDTGVHHTVGGWMTRRWIRVASGLGFTAIALSAAADVVVQGRRHLDIGVPADNNHGVDDRTAVKWLLAQSRPGDAVVATRLGWPGIWWYGNIPLSPRPPGGKLPGGVPMIEMYHQRIDCGTDLETLASEHQRLIVYVGFPDHEPEFRSLVVEELRTVGRIVESRDFAALSRVLIVETGSAPPAPTSPAKECVGVGVARRW